MALGKAYQEITDARALSEYYSEILAYTPRVLNDAAKEGDSFERFKTVVRYGFSILHAMQLQEIEGRRPVVPIVGETYEGHYMPGHASQLCNVYMESDYCKHSHTDLLIGTKT